jgi:hypothetical protein
MSVRSLRIVLLYVCANMYYWMSVRWCRFVLLHVCVDVCNIECIFYSFEQVCVTGEGPTWVCVLMWMCACVHTCEYVILNAFFTVLSKSVTRQDPTWVCAHVDVCLCTYVWVYILLNNYQACQKRWFSLQFWSTANLKIIDVRYQLSTVFSTSLLLETRWNHDNGRRLFWDWQYVVLVLDFDEFVSHVYFLSMYVCKMYVSTRLQGAFKDRYACLRRFTQANWGGTHCSKCDISQKHADINVCKNVCINKALRRLVRYACLRRFTQANWHGTHCFKWNKPWQDYADVCMYVCMYVCMCVLSQLRWHSLF